MQIQRQYVCHSPFQAQIGDEGSGVIVKILSADPRSTVGIGIITPSINARIWNIQREKITEPVDTVYCPSRFTMSIQSMNGHNTTIKP